MTFCSSQSQSDLSKNDLVSESGKFKERKHWIRFGFHARECWARLILNMASLLISFWDEDLKVSHKTVMFLQKEQRRVFMAEFEYEW